MVKHSMDLLELLRKRGMDGDVDFLREALRVLVDTIMDAEVSAQIGAEHGERSPERVTYRNGYRNRTWDTRVGTTELNIKGVAHSQAAGGQLLPQPAGTAAAQREGPAVGDPAGLPFGRLRTGVEGVSTRRVDDLIKALGCDVAVPAARCRASAETWTKWWGVSWVGPWTVARIPTCGWTA